MKVGVLLVDDSVPFLDAAEDFLLREPRLTVVGRAQSGAEALRMVSALRPDLVLLDLGMPGMDGLTTARRIKATLAPPRVVILSLRDTPRDRTAAAAVADGFVSKADFGTALLATIERLFSVTDQEAAHDG